MSDFFDCYKILGISFYASQEEIKRAYREKVKVYHPDKGGNPETFRQIQIAYKTLSDVKKRRTYDELLKRKQDQKRAQVAYQTLKKQQYQSHYTPSDYRSYHQKWKITPSWVSNPLLILFVLLGISLTIVVSAIHFILSPSPQNKTSLTSLKTVNSSVHSSTVSSAKSSQQALDDYLQKVDATGLAIFQGSYVSQSSIDDLKSSVTQFENYKTSLPSGLSEGNEYFVEFLQATSDSYSLTYQGNDPTAVNEKNTIALRYLQQFLDSISSYASSNHLTVHSQLFDYLEKK